MLNVIEEAFERLSDWIAGSGRPGSSEKLDEICNELGMTCSLSASSGRCRLIGDEADGEIELNYHRDTAFLGVRHVHYSLTAAPPAAPRQHREWLVVEASAEQSLAAQGRPRLGIFAPAPERLRAHRG